MWRLYECGSRLSPCIGDIIPRAPFERLCARLNSGGGRTCEFKSLPLDSHLTCHRDYGYECRDWAAALFPLSPSPSVSTEPLALCDRVRVRVLVTAAVAPRVHVTAAVALRVHVTAAVALRVHIAAAVVVGNTRIAVARRDAAAVARRCSVSLTHDHARAVPRERISLDGVRGHPLPVARSGGRVGECGGHVTRGRDFSVAACTIQLTVR